MIWPKSLESVRDCSSRAASLISGYEAILPTTVNFRRPCDFSSLPFLGLRRSARPVCDTTRQAGSQIASLGGHVNITAGDHYDQIASQVIASKADISIKAKDVDIKAGFAVLSTNHTASSSWTAVDGSINIALVAAAQAALQAVWTNRFLLWLRSGAFSRRY